MPSKGVDFDTMGINISVLNFVENCRKWRFSNTFERSTASAPKGGWAGGGAWNLFFAAGFMVMLALDVALR